MSTLKVATIQDTSGNNSSTPSEVAQGRAKAWVNFNGTGTVAIRDNFNVSSITDHGTGEYTANLTTAMANTNGAPVGNANEFADSHNGGLRCVEAFFTSTSAVRCAVNYVNGGMSDSALVNIVVFGD